LARHAAVRGVSFEKWSAWVACLDDVFYLHDITAGDSRAIAQMMKMDVHEL
jgi:hypothetical protein